MPDDNGQAVLDRIEAVKKGPLAAAGITPEQIDELVMDKLREKIHGATTDEEVQITLTKRECNLVRACLHATPFKGAAVMTVARIMMTLDEILGPMPRAPQQ